MPRPESAGLQDRSVNSVERRRLDQIRAHPLQSRFPPKLIDFGCAVGGGITTAFTYGGEPTEHLRRSAFNAAVYTGSRGPILDGKAWASGSERQQCRAPSPGSALTHYKAGIPSFHKPRLAELIGEMTSSGPWDRPSSDEVSTRLRALGAESAGTTATSITGFSRVRKIQPQHNPSTGGTKGWTWKEKSAATVLGGGIAFGLYKLWENADEDFKDEAANFVRKGVENAVERGLDALQDEIDQFGNALQSGRRSADSSLWEDELLDSEDDEFDC